MKRTLSTLAAACIAITATGSFATSPGAAASSKNSSISQARSECAVRKQRVAGLEARNADEALLARERKDWEHACEHAQELIAAASGVTPPPVVPQTDAR